MRDHAFEDRLNELLRDGRLGLGKPTSDALAVLVERLETIPELLVQKRRAQPARRSMVEVGCAWTGMDADADEVVVAIEAAVADALPSAMRTRTVEPDLVKVRFHQEKNGVFVTGAVICTLA